MSPSKIPRSLIPSFQPIPNFHDEDASTRDHDSFDNFSMGTQPPSALLALQDVQKEVIRTQKPSRSPNIKSSAVSTSHVSKKSDQSLERADDYDRKPAAKDSKSDSESDSGEEKQEESSIPPDSPSRRVESSPVGNHRRQAATRRRRFFNSDDNSSESGRSEESPGRSKGKSDFKRREKLLTRCPPPWRTLAMKKYSSSNPLNESNLLGARKQPAESPPDEPSSPTSSLHCNESKPKARRSYRGSRDQIRLSSKKSQEQPDRKPAARAEGEREMESSSDEESEIQVVRVIPPPRQLAPPVAAEISSSESEQNSSLSKPKIQVVFDAKQLDRDRLAKLASQEKQKQSLKSPPPPESLGRQELPEASNRTKSKRSSATRSCPKLPPSGRKTAMEKHGDPAPVKLPPPVVRLNTAKPDELGGSVASSSLRLDRNLAKQKARRPQDSRVRSRSSSSQMPEERRDTARTKRLREPESSSDESDESSSSRLDNSNEATRRAPRSIEEPCYGRRFSSQKSEVQLERNLAARPKRRREPESFSDELYPSDGSSLPRLYHKNEAQQIARSCNGKNSQEHLDRKPAARSKRQRETESASCAESEVLIVRVVPPPQQAAAPVAAAPALSSKKSKDEVLSSKSKIQVEFDAQQSDKGCGAKQVSREIAKQNSFKKSPSPAAPPRQKRPAAKSLLKFGKPEWRRRDLKTMSAPTGPYYPSSRESDDDKSK